MEATNCQHSSFSNETTKKKAIHKSLIKTNATFQM